MVRQLIRSELGPAVFRESGHRSQHGTSTGTQPATCAIGSVVDAQLRVLGIDGLRVADASFLLSVPRGNTTPQPS
ncbi:GMC oxidoreductase [Streptomyces fodineus]|uniref:GMC oxidoreductase n=1 Tax=Streptomyces fodineus TaxID=1904616 RepID=UPI003AAA8F37